MSEEYKREVKAEALLKYTELQQRLGVLTYQARTIGENLEALGKNLKTNPSVIDALPPSLKDHEDLGRLVEDIRETEKALRRQGEDLLQMGSPLPKLS